MRKNQDLKWSRYFDSTDPDCDRLALEVIHEGGKSKLNETKIGGTLINYVVKGLLEKIKCQKILLQCTIVTGKLGEAIGLLETQSPFF